MSKGVSRTEKLFEVDSIDTALAIFGSCDENIRLLEQAFGVTAVCRGTQIKLTGSDEGAAKAAKAIDSMLTLRENGTPLELSLIHIYRGRGEQHPGL